jgi:hypothetical protein
MGKENPVTVAVDCFRQNTCPSSPTTDGGLCSWLKPQDIQVPFELSLEDRIDSLNNEEPLRRCVEIAPRYRVKME